MGDDGLAHPFAARIGRDLAAVAREKPVAFMHGNRDFLVAGGFSQATGVRLLEDPTPIDLYGTPTLLMHGDTLCTGDLAYQALRRQVRDPKWQAATLAKPIQERIALARSLRDGSEGAKQAKSMEIMDVAPEAVEAAFASSGAKVIIHGHTHRPARHVHRVNGAERVRWVLPDWYERGGYLEASPAGIRPLDAL